MVTLHHISLVLSVLWWGGISAGAADPEAPALPLQFTATVEITAHLVDRSKSYPPWLRIVEVAYDYPGKKARAVVTAGYEEGKTFLRRYDNKTEFMVRSGEFAECQRAYLGEVMPLPELPLPSLPSGGLTFVGEESVTGMTGVGDEMGNWDHWMQDLGSNRVHVYVAVIRNGAAGNDKWPVRVTDEQVIAPAVGAAAEVGGESVPLMTYDFKNLKIGPPGDVGADEGAELFSIPAPYNFRSCTRNIGGFPYLHLFHTFLRF